MARVSSHARSRLPTIRDVARRAGVGIGTVSRVLNASAGVSAETEARVRLAIEELGYRRSSTARNLALGRSHAIGVIAPFFTSPSVVERLRGVAELAAGRDHDLLLFAVETPKQRADALREYARHNVDGLLVISLPLSDEEVGYLRRQALPVVLVDVGHRGLPHVMIDDERGGELATEHLLARGHTRIGFVGDIPTNPFGFTSSEHRRVGYHRALRRAGIAPDPALERRGRFGRPEARELAESLLSDPDPPTAIFAASDVQAFGVLEAAGALGLRVPEDVALIGFDDIETAAIVGLTTVRQPLLETGARGAELLFAAIDGEDALAVVEFDDLSVIERSTT